MVTKKWFCSDKECGTVYAKKPTKLKCISFRCKGKTVEYVLAAPFLKLLEAAVESTDQHWANCVCDLCEIIDEIQNEETPQDGLVRRG